MPCESPVLDDRPPGDGGHIPAAQVVPYSTTERISLKGAIAAQVWLREVVEIRAGA